MAEGLRDSVNADGPEGGKVYELSNGDIVKAGMMVDVDGNPVYRGVPKQSTLVNQAIGAASARKAIPSAAKTIRISSDVDCWYALGDSTVTVSSTTGAFLPAGIEVIAVGDNTYIAVIQDSVAGNLNIVEMI